MNRVLGAMAIALLSMACTESSRELPKSYRAMVYSKDFAAHFRLKPSGVYPLDRGLQAVVVRVIERTDHPPACALDLYVDDSLELAYPEGSEGRLRYDDDEDPLFFVQDAKALGPALYRWSTRLGNLHAVACGKPEGAGDCVFEEGAPSAYSRRLTPGLALVTYRLGCNLFDPKYLPLEMWLLKQGRDSQELDPRTGDEAATYRFSIPATLLRYSARRTGEAMAVYEKPLPREPAHGQFSVPARP